MGRGSRFKDPSFERTGVRVESVGSCIGPGGLLRHRIELDFVK